MTGRGRNITTKRKKENKDEHLTTHGEEIGTDQYTVRNSHTMNKNDTTGRLEQSGEKLTIKPKKNSGKGHSNDSNRLSKKNPTLNKSESTTAVQNTLLNDMLQNEMETNNAEMDNFEFQEEFQQMKEKDLLLDGDNDDNSDEDAAIRAKIEIENCEEMQGINTDETIEEDQDPIKSAFKWTTDDETESLQKGDRHGKYIGYVFEIIGEKTTTRNKRVKHVVLHNYYGKFIQLTAWDTNIEKLNKVAVEGNVLNCKRLYVHEEKADSDYNYGDTQITLRVEFCSQLEVLGKIEIEKDKRKAITQANFDDITNHSGKIEIKGYVKNNFRRNKFNTIAGSITNGEKVLEIYISEKHKINEIKKGMEIILVGKLKKKQRPTHYLEIQENDEIVLTKERTTLLELLKGRIHI